MIDRFAKLLNGFLAVNYFPEKSPSFSNTSDTSSVIIWHAYSSTADIRFLGLVYPAYVLCVLKKRNGLTENYRQKDKIYYFKNKKLIKVKFAINNSHICKNSIQRSYKFILICT